MLLGKRARRRLAWFLGGFVIFLALPISAQEDEPGWLKGHAVHIPTEFTNQESGYFSIVEGLNGRVYVGTAKYGVNSYLVEWNPLKMVMQMVVDVHRVLRKAVKGFAAQAKIHTRNNVGESGKIYFGTKQGYPEKEEKRTDYLGGYVMAYDPKSGETENFGMPKKHHGVISVTPDEKRGKIYVSTCDDGRPIESSHFMVYDMKTKEYRDLGETQHSYAFIVVDHKGRAYHPIRGGQVLRFDPDADKLEKLDVTVDGQPAPKAITKDGAILNWDWSPDKKTLWCVEMSTNELFSFDLTTTGTSIPGKKLGPLLAKAKSTDCRAMCVGTSGKVWAAVTEQGLPGGQMLHLVSYTPGAKAPRNHGKVA
ncbi:MAG: SMP-30/gluconolactonase/LRE family protein, partial [Gemmataceae bacterium]|nr:SMP-30/gluconolactonase/LRE family protein [Gemmataceae bacterium]